MSDESSYRWESESRRESRARSRSRLKVELVEKRSMNIKTDRYPCWKCGKKTLPTGIVYTISTPNSEKLKVKFCSGLRKQKKCNLSSILLTDTQDRYYKQSAHNWSSWKNREAYLGMRKRLRDSYQEACKDFANNCYASAVMMCRAMLIRIAIENGYEGKLVKDGAKHTDFVGAIKHLEREDLIPSFAKEILHFVRKLGNMANHELINIDDEFALIVLVSLDSALKCIYIPDMENMKPKFWYCVPIMAVAGLDEIASDKSNIGTTGRIIKTIQEHNPTLQKLISKMSEHQDCKETVRELMDKKRGPGTQSSKEILATDSGKACMNYIKSLPELNEFIKNAT